MALNQAILCTLYNKALEASLNLGLIINQRLKPNSIAKHIS